MSASDYPLYVDDLGHGLQVPEIPAGCDGSTIYSFFLPGSNGAMQATVDKFLNAPAAGAVRYQVIGAHALLTFSFTQRHTSIPQVIGYIGDYECACWIPLLARGGGLPDRITYWIPYLFISWPEGMATGREIWGFRKEVADIAIPAPGQPATFTCQGRVFDPFGQNTQARMAPLVTLHRPGLLPPLTSAGEHLTEMLEAIIGFWRKVWWPDRHELPASELDLAMLLGKMLLARHLPVVNLKQFRDAADSTRACYQAIIESTCTPTRFGGWGLLDEGFVVDLPRYDSHRIAEDLGVTGQTGVPLVFGCWAQLDFTADAGREVWRAG